MVRERILAVSEWDMPIMQLPEETQEIIRTDLRQHARENYYQLKYDFEQHDFEDMKGTFADIEKKIYQHTFIVPCKPGEDIEPFEKSMQVSFTLRLRDDDVKGLCRKAAENNITVSELLEAFISDLIDGSKTNGSDERLYANRWFERCNFDFEDGTTFLQYLIMFDELEYFSGLCDTIKALEDLDEPDEDDRENLQVTKEEIQNIFDNYLEMEWVPRDETLEDGVKAVSEWLMEHKKLLRWE